jgi:hypothetical protein
MHDNRSSELGSLFRHYSEWQMTSGPRSCVKSPQAQGVPDKIKKLFFGMKSRTEQEAERQRLIASEAQWRAEYNSKQVRAYLAWLCNETVMQGG